jgi:hypothetical protein
MELTMATITSSVNQANQTPTTVSKTYTLSDADMDAAVAAYQQGANTAINGTATRNQVLSYMFDQMIVKEMQAAVQSHKTVPAQVPPPITIT